MTEYFLHVSVYICCNKVSLNFIHNTEVFYSSHKEHFQTMIKRFNALLLYILLNLNILQIKTWTLTYYRSRPEPQHITDQDLIQQSVILYQPVPSWLQSIHILTWKLEIVLKWMLHTQKRSGTYKFYRLADLIQAGVDLISTLQMRT